MSEELAVSDEVDFDMNPACPRMCEGKPRSGLESRMELVEPASIQPNRIQRRVTSDQVLTLLVDFDRQTVVTTG